MRSICCLFCLFTLALPALADAGPIGFIEISGSATVTNSPDSFARLTSFRAVFDTSVAPDTGTPGLVIFESVAAGAITLTNTGADPFASSPDAGAPFIDNEIATIVYEQSTDRWGLVFSASLGQIQLIINQPDAAFDIVMPSLPSDPAQYRRRSDAVPNAPVVLFEGQRLLQWTPDTGFTSPNPDDDGAFEYRVTQTDDPRIEPCPADLAAPFGVLNFFDLVEYLNRFNAGCP